MNPDRIRRCVLAALFSATLAGCSGHQSSLNPAGPESRTISNLWWLFCVVTSVVYVLVLAAVVFAIARREFAAATPILGPEPRNERRIAIIIGALVGFTIVILFVFLIADLTSGRRINSLADAHPLRIQIIGHQWWWEIKYDDPIPTRIITTANEIHVPVGKAVEFELQSMDVIHSFWVPNLNGKKDLIPGHPTRTWFKADRIGTYFGQCAEFCGLQHAHMRFVFAVTAEKEFEEWQSAQRRSAAPPRNEEQKRGQEVFLTGNCIACHTISGTPARGTVGPDLSHLAGRQTLGAGTVFNTKGHLAGWIMDAPQIKPGVRMPQNQLEAGELQALLAYLGNLK